MKQIKGSKLRQTCRQTATQAFRLANRKINKIDRTEVETYMLCKHRRKERERKEKDGKITVGKRTKKIRRRKKRE